MNFLNPCIRTSKSKLCVHSTVNSLDLGTPYCTCLEGASCTPPLGGGGDAVTAAPSSGGAWGGALLALAALLAAVLAALYLIHRRRQLVYRVVLLYSY